MSDDKKSTILALILIAVVAVALAAAAIEPVECSGGRCDVVEEPELPYRAVSAVDLPYPMREANYAGGSCVHASTIMVLRWQGRHELADKWRRKYAGGEYSWGLTRKAETEGLRYAYTDHGDAFFLDWTSRTRRGAVIFYFPQHAIMFCGFNDAGQAVLLDNNRIDHYLYVPRDAFIQRWKGYGGFAFTPVYNPPPEKPYI